MIAIKQFEPPEQKLKWGEENWLFAAYENYSIKQVQSQTCLSDAECKNNRPTVNGFVSNYLYDADGERTVKTSGDNDAVYVNSGFSGGNTGTTRFTLYVSPYYVASSGGRYTKHVYIGGQCVVSKLGQLKIGNVDPRITAKAGGEDSGLSVDYLGKYAQQLEALKDNYRTFDLPYNGADNTDPDEGRSFCCEDGRRGTSGMRAATDNFHEADAYQRLQFYYHSDHLGNSTYITNLDAEITQHIEYVPFGEVFIEEHNNTWNTPYLFNAKEFDEETGLYYYGARYYDPRLSLWMSVDPFAEDYSALSAYSYCANNPINGIDIKGEKILLVNGYWKSGVLGRLIGSDAPKQQYWGAKFAQEAQKFFSDYSVISEKNYIDGSSKWGGDMSGSDRYKAGYTYAKSHIDELKDGLKEGEAFNIVTHSEGAAYGAGIAKYLLDEKYKVNMILHLSADEGDEFSTPQEPYTLQLSFSKD